VDSLWQTVAATAQRAAEIGALVTLPTETVTIPDLGIPFLVHLTILQETKTQATSGNGQQTPNPFLPPDPELIVARHPPRHLSVLNKFNVLANHLLIVTREFEAQESLLTRDDFHALTDCMSHCDGVAFFNGGVVAGASQAHKHLQLVPFPLGEGPDPTPVDAVIDAGQMPGEPTTVRQFDFDHALIPLDGDRLDASCTDDLSMIYRRACRLLDISDGAQPYNLVLTRRWMLVVPRVREFWNGVSINALGFAGSLLVRNRTELARLRETGPLRVLSQVARGRS
jgi:ATP adenylyltransferase